MENSGISWTYYTLNPWVGCTKVSPACNDCYAIKFDKRSGGNHWVVPPRMMADSNWKKPLTWQKKAVREGNNPLVFCGSMCDVMDKNAPEGQRERLFNSIGKTPDLTWLLLTKRSPNFKKYLPEDWGDGYDNVWLGVTVEDKKHGLPRIIDLKKIPAKIRFLSIEPLLEDLGELDLSGIDWVIVGGESGAKAKRREMKKVWVLNIKKQCEEQGVTFFFKQWNGAKIRGVRAKEDSLLDGVQYHNWPASYISATKRLPIMDFKVPYDDTLDLEGQLSELFNSFPNKPKAIKGIFKTANKKLLQQQLAIMNQFSKSEVLNILNKF